MLPVGDERRRADLAPDADAKDGDRLVDQEANQGRHPPEVRDWLRMDQLHHRLISHDGHRRSSTETL